MKNVCLPWMVVAFLALLALQSADRPRRCIQGRCVSTSPQGGGLGRELWRPVPRAMELGPRVGVGDLAVHC